MENYKINIDILDDQKALEGFIISFSSYYEAISNEIERYNKGEEYYSDELITKYRKIIEGSNKVIDFITSHSSHANKYIEKIIKED